MPQLLAAFDDRFRAICDSIVAGDYVFWLGSGISRGRVANVQAMILKSLMHLQQQKAAARDPDIFDAALGQVIALAQLSPDEKAAIDVAMPADRWGGLVTILNRLATNYPRVLNVRVVGEAADYMLWDGVDVRAEYADDSIRPDCEHICLAILAMEGIAPSLVTANWDGLIEAAVSDLRGPESTWALQVYVRPDDFRSQGNGALYKFHGCAVKAKADEGVYREYLIGSDVQITRWSNSDRSEQMRNRLTDLAAHKRTLIVGLSAQDENIRQVFSVATKGFNWPWPSDPPACVVAGSGIGSDQRSVLQHVYGDAYDGGAGPDIELHSLIPAYAKPFLAALVLDVLCNKCIALLNHILPPSFDESDRAELGRALKRMRSMLAPPSGADLLDYVWAVVDVTGHVLSIFRRGTSTRNVVAAFYQPLTTASIAATLADPNIPLSRLREFSVGLAAIGIGVLRGLWNISLPDRADPMAPSLELSSATERLRGFIVADSEAAARLGMEGRMSDEDPSTLLIFCSAVAASPTRSPRVPYGRVGRPSARIVSISDLVRSAGDLETLLRLVTEQVAL